MAEFESLLPQLVNNSFECMFDGLYNERVEVFLDLDIFEVTHIYLFLNHQTTPKLGIKYKAS